MDYAEKGDIVTIKYTLKFTNGTLYDSNETSSALTFKLGQGIFFPGFEKAIEGMKIGDSKIITISEKDAFGHKRPELIKSIPLSSIPAHINKKLGQRISIEIPDNPTLTATITDVSSDAITIDANPPQAGQAFVATIRLLDIEIEES